MKGGVVFLETTIFIILFGAISILTYLIIGALTLKSKSSNVQKSFFRLDSFLKERWDMLPYLINSIKYELKSERKLIEEIILLKNTTYDNMSNFKKIDTDIRLTSLLYILDAKTENCDIANDSFPELKRQWKIVHDRIKVARIEYEYALEHLKNAYRFFPKLLISILKIPTFPSYDNYVKEER